MAKERSPFMTSVRGSLAHLRDPGLWVLKLALVVQVLIVPWRPGRSNVLPLGYRPVWSPPHERFWPLIDMGMLVTTVLLTVGVMLLWAYLTRPLPDRPIFSAGETSNATESSTRRDDRLAKEVRALLPRLPLESISCQWMQIKTLLTVRGWNDGDNVQSLLTATAAARSACCSALPAVEHRRMNSVAAQVGLALLLVDDELRARFPGNRLELIDAVQEHAIHWAPSSAPTDSARR